jgi:hypothetical protein
MDEDAKDAAEAIIEAIALTNTRLAEIHSLMKEMLETLKVISVFTMQIGDD